MSVMTTRPITVTVAGRTYEMVPNIQAWRAITGRFGALRDALKCVENQNWDDVAFIIAVGNLKSMKQRTVMALGEALWADARRGEALSAVCDFLLVLNNGGRSVSDEEDADHPDPEKEGDEGNV